MAESLKVLSTVWPDWSILKDLTKVVQKYYDFFGYFESGTFKVKPAVGTNWAFWGKIGKLFIPTSGHTGSVATCPCRWTVEFERFEQINCCRRLKKVAQSPINRPIWSHSQSLMIATLKYVAITELYTWKLKMKKLTFRVFMLNFKINVNRCNTTNTTVCSVLDFLILFNITYWLTFYYF